MDQRLYLLRDHELLLPFCHGLATLFKKLCLSVGPSISPSVGHSIKLSIGVSVDLLIDLLRTS